MTEEAAVADVSAALTVEPAVEAKPAPPSRMEALERALKKVDASEGAPPAESRVEAKAEPKKAEPEAKAETKTEPKAEAKADAKAEPAQDNRTRGPDGKFVAKEVETAEVKADAPKAEPATDAPSRFSPDAKVAWKDAPAPVQAEVRRAITEMERGIAEKNQIIEPLKPFLQMAQQHGTTIHDALGKYIRMEQLLAKDPAQGLQAIAQNMGMTIGDLIQKVSGQSVSPEGNAKDREILALKQQLDELSGNVGNITQTFQQERLRQVETQVESFASQHPRFEELAPEIKAQIEQGHDLETAYRRAELLNPLPQIAKPAPPPAQTREVKSVTGSPTAGSNPANRKPSTSRQEALQRAAAATGLA